MTVDSEAETKATDAKVVEPTVAASLVVDEPAVIKDEDKAEPIRLPDDPGVDPDEREAASQSRFRLF